MHKPFYSYEVKSMTPTPGIWDTGDSFDKQKVEVNLHDFQG